MKLTRIKKNKKIKLKRSKKRKKKNIDPLSSEGMDQKINNLVKNFAEKLKPLPPMTIDKYSDKYRYLTTESSSEPGKWRTSRFPMLKKVMEAESPSDPCKRVVIQKGSQVGLTETGLNTIFYHIDYDPAPTLYIQKTIEAVQKFSKQRLDPSIKQNKSIENKLSQVKSANNKKSSSILLKNFPGGTLILGGANSASALRSMPIRILIADEVDSFESNIDEEGDPLTLAERRTSNFPNRKVIIMSTPKFEETSVIESEFKNGTMMYYFVPCPFCSKMQIIKWQNIIYKDKNGNEDLNNIYLECVKCKGKIKEYHKTEMLKNGKWIMTNPEGKYPSFHLSALYSPLGFYSWTEAVDLWLKSQRLRSKELLQVFINTVLGETYKESDKEIDPSWVRKRKEIYRSDVPSEVKILTCGVDVQLDRLEMEVVGFGSGLETWSIDYNVIMGDPEQNHVWDQLDKYLSQTWQHESGDKIGLSCTAIDSGNMAKIVYNFVKPREFKRVFAIKGKSGWGQGYIKRPKKKLEESKVWLWILYVDELKSKVYSQLRIDKQGAGYCHFPDKPVYDENYFNQLTSEVLKKKKNKLEWVLPNGRRNEALDCRVYSYGALSIIKPYFDQAINSGKPLTMGKKNGKFNKSKGKKRKLSSGL